MAQTRMDCPDPALKGIDPDTRGIERLDAIILVQEHKLCLMRNFRSADWVFRPAAHEAFFDAFEEFLSIEIDLYKSRLSMPSTSDIQETLQEIGRHGLSKKITDFMDATMIIYEEDKCAQNPIFSRDRVFDCPVDLYGTQISQKYGMELRPWVEKAAVELRSEPLPPWFRLGAVSVRYEPDSLAHLRLKTALEEAGRARGDAQVELASRRQAASQAKEKRRASLDPLRTQISKALQALASMEQARRPNASAVMASQQWENFAHIARTAEKRVQELDTAIEHVFATEGDRPAGQLRLKELQSERDAQSAISEQAWADRTALIEPQYSAEETARRKVLTNAIMIDRADHDRRAKLNKGWISETVAAVQRAQANLENVDARLATAQREMQDWYANQKLLNLTRLETKHATLVPAEESEIREMQLHIKSLRAEIERRIAARSELESARRKARKTMLAAGAHADDMNLRLAAAGWGSMLAQATLEVAFVAKDLKDAAALGPQAMLVVATQNLVGNVIWPPTYYDATSQKLSNYALGHEGPDDWELIDLDPSVITEKTRAQIEKQWRQMPFKVMLQVLKEDAARAAVDNSWKRYLHTSAGTRGFLHTIGKQELKLAEISQEMLQMTGKAGMRAAAHHFGAKMVEGLAKSLAKEATKKAIAEFFEGHFLEDYMVSQMELGQAVTRFQHAGSLYWVNEDAITVMRAQLSGILLRNPGPTVLTPEKNAAFFPKASYRFEFTFPDATPKDLAAAEITIIYGGVELERDPGATTPVWRMPENARAVFGRDLPEDLPVEIVLH